MTWNKGLTKANDERVKKLARSLSATRKGKIEEPIVEQIDNSKKIIKSIEDTIIRNNGVIYLSERDYKTLKKKIEFIIRDVKCPHCNLSDTKEVEKQGLRKTGYIQNPRYFCKSCNKSFKWGNT